MKRRVGILGYGHLGKYLLNNLMKNPDKWIVDFVWNRSKEKIQKTENANFTILQKIEDIKERNVDIVLEVSHPRIICEYGKLILTYSDILIGSPTALADPDVEAMLRKTCIRTGHSVYIPSGALWGANDIEKMDQQFILKSLKITMSKPPESLKLGDDLQKINGQVKDKATVLYDGPVRGLCALAPNNVNTMAAAALAAPNLGFDGVNGCLISDPALKDKHLVEVEIEGPINESTKEKFKVKTTRSNPAQLGRVTGSATFESFYCSLLRAHSKEPGIHIC